MFLKVEKLMHYQKTFYTKQFNMLLEVETKSYNKSREKLMGKVKKSGKIGQEQKTLTSAFA